MNPWHTASSMDLDYQAPRPFMHWQRPDLLEKIQEWVALNPPRLELATLPYEELKNRGENRARAALRLFPDHLPPIPWLTAARQDVLADLGPSTTPRANGRLYVILRSGYTEMNGFYGAYVGVTRHRVEDRFRQHRTGIRAARGLQEHGIELLYSLFSWANPVPGGKDIRRMHETKLHELLAKRAVSKVSGDRFHPCDQALPLELDRKRQQYLKPPLVVQSGS